MEKITLEIFTPDYVHIKKQAFVVVEGIEYLTGEPQRSSYTNSIRGRAAVEMEVSEPYRTAIIAVWGDTPTVVDLSVD